MRCINPETLVVVSFILAIVSRYFSEAFTFVYLAKWNTQVKHHMTLTILNLENAQMAVTYPCSRSLFESRVALRIKHPYEEQVRAYRI